MNRRTFLRLLASAAALFDPRSPSPLLTRVRRVISDTVGERGIGIDLRKLDVYNAEQFRIQLNAYRYFPIASCFKTFLVLYYFWYTPQEEWDSAEDSDVYRTAVFSDNLATGRLMDEVSTHVGGTANAVEKFNDFLTYRLNAAFGLYSWNWEGSPTVGLIDARFAPTSTRSVEIPAGTFAVENVCTANDLANGYAFLARTDSSDLHPNFQEVLNATRAVMSIPAANYQSPIERAFPQGYTGKDGILPSDELPTGRVVNDAGLIAVDDGQYILSLLSAGESESAVVDILRLIASELADVQVYMWRVELP